MPEEVRADLLLGRDTLSPGLIKAGEAASKASGNVRQLTRDLYEAGKTRATPVVDLNDAAATAKLASVSQKLRDLGARVADPKISVEDKAAQASIAGMRVKLDALGRKVASPRVTLEGLARAEAGILTLDAQLDRLDAKHATATVGVNRGGLLSRLSGLLGGGGAAGGAAGAGGLGALGPAGLGIVAALAAALAPAAIPLGLGGLIGGGGAFAGLKIGSAAEQQLLQMQKSLGNITGHTPSSNAARARIQAQIAAFQKASADQLQLGAAGARFQHSVTGTFLDALTSRSPGFSAGPHGQPGGSFLSGLTPILRQLAGFVRSIGPQLGDMFRASLPFVSAFVKVMEQFARAVLPAVTQSLKIMAPDLPIITQGFKLVAQGIAGFIQNLGPGMKDSAIIFKAAMEIVKGLLQLTGLAVAAFAITIVKTAEAVRAFARGIPPFFDKMRHDIAVIFDGIRSMVASAWNIIWNNTVARVRTGVGDVVAFFKGLPGKVLGALTGLGHQLWQFGSFALGQFWAGLKSIGATILGWLGSFWHSIIGLAKKILGVFSPSSVFFDIGKNLMLGLEGGIKAHAHTAVNAARSAAQRAAGAGAHGGPTSASAGQAQAYARSRLAAFGWSASQMGPLIALWNQESGWNRLARNPSSGAYGIPQALPASKMGAAANPPTSSAAAQINWGLGYIKGRYGSPAGAWAHERAFNWYGSGGMITEPVLGLGLRSGRGYGFGERGPEMVTPARGGAVARIQLEWVGGNAGDGLLQWIQKNVRIRGGGDVQKAFGRP